jgi:hypothetical protein
VRRRASARRRRTWIVLAAGLWLTAAHAGASPPPAAADLRSALAATGCASAGGANLVAARDAISASSDLAAAQRIALSYSRPARGALARARWLVPWSDLGSAEDRLRAYEAAVLAGPDPAAVAVAFAGLVRIPAPGPALTADWLPGSDGLFAPGPRFDLGDDDGCDFSTGEIIAIVLGFILGIIPGIILLILLC